MKLTLNWLKDYVDFDWSPEELAERLTMLGLEVEGMEKTSGAFENIVVAQVIKKEQHPDADRLSLCQVNDGTGERQIVCGATNFVEGSKVALALPGCEMPTAPGEKPFVIKPGKIRGVKSEGMMCSGKELGLTADSDGLMLLPEDAKVGQPFGEHLGRAKSDVIYDLETTPNRPDWNSVIGIAREISVLTGNPLRKLDTGSLSEATDTPSAEDTVSVSLKSEVLCPRYTARVIRGVKVGPSPDWLRERLEAVGIRSISNVVDVTNFVMLEMGHPLHAFDLHLLSRNAEGKSSILVRTAEDGEVFTTLDEQERKLDTGNLVIADEEKAVALAGVMGGLNTEINDNTKDVLIESAYFEPRSIRATSKKLGLSTDSSYRFERGADVEICDEASRRAAQLILETAGGSLAAGAVDARSIIVEPATITLRFARTREILGIEIPPADQVETLKRLELRIVSQDENSVTVQPASFRVDLKGEIDLIEEVCRIYGVDRIPSTPPRGAFGINDHDTIHDRLAEVRQLLIGMGLFEAQGQTLVSEKAARLAAEDHLPLVNPLSQDMNVVRPSLIPGLLDILRHNANRSLPGIALFEIGRTFPIVEGAAVEDRKLAIALTGERTPEYWAEKAPVVFDMMDLIGVVETLLERMGVRGIQFRRHNAPTQLFAESASMLLGKKELGVLGQLMPPLAWDYDLKKPAFMAEVSLTALFSLARAKTSYETLPEQPSIRRDVAMLVDEDVSHFDVEKAVRRAKADFLESVELFDIYRSEDLGMDKKSVAYALTYRHPERTLKDKEADKSHARIVASLENNLGAQIR